MENKPSQIGFNAVANQDSPPSYAEVQDLKSNQPQGSAVALPSSVNMPVDKINQPKLLPLPPIRPANITQTTIEIPRQPPTATNAGTETWEDFSTITDQTIRMKFIRKVYGILTVQLLITFGLVIVFTTVQKIRDFAITPSGYYLYIASYVMFFVLIIVLSCCQCSEGLRKFPINYILLTLITLSMTLMLGMISAYYSTLSVLFAIGITIIIVLGVTLFAIQTKFDFTNWWMVLFCFLLSLVVSGISIGVAFYYNVVLQGVYGAIGAVLMSLFLAIDTQLLMGRKGRAAFSPEDYINAALQLYIDICYIFIYIVIGMGKR